MILKDNDSIRLIVKCNCGCSGLELNKFTGSDGTIDYFIYHTITSFDAGQTTLFSRVKRKLQIVWEVLTNGFYKYNQIYLTEDEFNELKEVISNY